MEQHEMRIGQTMPANKKNVSFHEALEDLSTRAEYIRRESRLLQCAECTADLSVSRPPGPTLVDGGVRQHYYRLDEADAVRNTLPSARDAGSTTGEQPTAFSLLGAQRADARSFLGKVPGRNATTCCVPRPPCLLQVHQPCDYVRIPLYEHSSTTV